MSACDCLLAGFCERHQTRKSQRDWELCQGVNCTPDIAAKYRQMWDDRAANKIGKIVPRVTVKPGQAQRVYDPVPRDQWPAAVTLIAQLAAPEDAGIGDTIKRQLGVAGQIYQTAFRLLTGSNCFGCGFRQRKWNQLYPYDHG